MEMTTPAVTVEHVVQAHRVASVAVHLPGSGSHRVGHHPAYPGDGWRCLRCDSPICPAIDEARGVVVAMD